MGWLLMRLNVFRVGIVVFFAFALKSFLMVSEREDACFEWTMRGPMVLSPPSETASWSTRPDKRMEWVVRSCKTTGAFVDGYTRPGAKPVMSSDDFRALSDKKIKSFGGGPF